jgi:Protein phosphatase 2C
MSKVPLNDLPRQKLCEIVDTYGRYIYDDPQRCNGLLLDYCAEYRREINILMNALEEQVVAELLVSSSRESYEGMLSRLAWRLCENYGLAEDFARWGVESWALALGIISEEALETLDAVETEPELEKKITPEWRAIGTSVKGEVHIRENLPNQDYISWQQNGEKGLPLVLAVADGHEDEQYFRSDVGAQLAVQVALQVLEGFCSTINATTVQDTMKDLPPTIVAKWKEKVEAHWLQNLLTEEETKWLSEPKNTTIVRLATKRSCCNVVYYASKSTIQLYFLKLQVRRRKWSALYKSLPLLTRNQN